MKKVAYFNGKFVSPDLIKISPYDIGLLRGFGVFDVMCTQNGKPFFLKEHWNRFKNSAKELNLKMPIGEKRYQEIIEKLLRENNFKKSTIRTVLTGGLSSNGFSYEPNKETFFILIEKFNPMKDEFFSQGVGVITVDYSRHFPKSKITNYVAAIKNQKNKERSRAIEIIYIQNGKALEASTSNFFLVKNEKIITTKEGVLLGITRNLVIKIAKKNNFKVEERNISERELYSASEIFLTATNKDVVPVVKINGKRVGNGKPGKVTQRIMKIFDEFSKKY